jgi:hypothetical protein
LAKLSFDVLAAVKNVQNRHVLVLHGMDDHVLSNEKLRKPGRRSSRVRPKRGYWLSR